MIWALIIFVQLGAPVPNQTPLSAIRVGLYKSEAECRRAEAPIDLIQSEGFLNIVTECRLTKGGKNL